MASRILVDGVHIAYDVSGCGSPPVLFLHEYGATKDDWSEQVAHFARSRKVITPNAVGYPPSDVPDDPAAYSIERQVGYSLALLKHLGESKAHIVGHSMGGHAALEFALRHPEAVSSIVLVGAGSGQGNKEGFRKMCMQKADELDAQGLAALEGYSRGTTRRRFEMKNPKAWDSYFNEAPRLKHSAKGRANTLRGFQATRPVWFDQEAELQKMQVPTLIIVGDEDEPCINPGLFLKKHIPCCGMAIVPQTGHTLPVEEPEKFNKLLEQFLAEVEAPTAGRWVPLDGVSNDAFSASMGSVNTSSESGPPAKRQRVDLQSQHDGRGKDFASLPKPPSCASTMYSFVDAAGCSDEQLRGKVVGILDRIGNVDQKSVRSLIPEEGRRDRVLHTLSAMHQGMPLRGMLLGVMDIISVDGLKTCAGSAVPCAAFHMPESPVVTRLRRAGAVVVGKTTTTEFAMSEAVSTANPHDTRRSAGGSSSGSAAAVAAGLCHIALGTQTGGSIIRPASYCGVVAAKFTHGRVPSDEGVLTLSRSLDHVGLFGCDLSAVITASSFLLDRWDQTRLDSARAPAEALCLAVPDGPYLEKADPAIQIWFEDKLKKLQTNGVKVCRLSAFVKHQELVQAHKQLLAYDVGVEHKDVFEKYGPLFRPNTAMMILRGQEISKSEAVKAMEAQSMFAQELEEQLVAAECHLWVTPAATCEAPFGYSTTGDSAMQVPWSFTGMPSLTLPAGLGPSGGPVGLQFIAARNQDEQLLAWAESLLKQL